MADGGYTSVDGFGVTKVTSEIGESIKNALADFFVSKLTFPRLRLASFPDMGYAASDFKAIADKIKPGKVEVYRTKEEQIFRAKYCSYGDDNFYVLTPMIAASPKVHLKTIVHETTHAIQDWKEWKESALDREVDAHFAAALYLVHSGKTHEANDDTVMTYFMIGAEAYKEDPKEIRSLWFNKIHKEMKNAVSQHYQFMHKKLFPDKDPAKFLKGFEKKNRLDGIPD